MKFLKLTGRNLFEILKLIRYRTITEVLLRIVSLGDIASNFSESQTINIDWHSLSFHSIESY